jgi:cytochrome c551/c552
MMTTTTKTAQSKTSGSQSIWSAASLLIIALFLFSGCSSDGDNKQSRTGHDDIQLAEEDTPVDDGKGIGPVKEVNISGFDAALAEKGKAIYEGKCSACHQLTEQKIVGPGLKGVTEKRSPEWIMNMIINPEEMTKKDPTAKKLLAEHLTQMTNQDVSEQDARALLEFMRQIDGAK